MSTYPDVLMHQAEDQRDGLRTVVMSQVRAIPLIMHSILESIHLDGCVDPLHKK